MPGHHSTRRPGRNAAPTTRSLAAAIRLLRAAGVAAPAQFSRCMIRSNIATVPMRVVRGFPVPVGGHPSVMKAEPTGARDGSGRPGSSAPAIGVEEEFLLVDAGTGHPRLRNSEVAAAAEELGLTLQLELSRCQVETATPVCHDSGGLRSSLLRMRSTLAAAALREGCRPVAAGVPILGPRRMPITAVDRRYRRMEKRFGWLTIEQGVCGCHVHVDVEDREMAVQVSNQIRPWLPTLLSLSANSSIHRGLDTGCASWRSILWSRWPASGPPPLFRSADHYDNLVDTLVGSGLLLDERMVYWDVRPSCHLPTVEIRVADVQPTVDETVLLAALIRALVMTATRAVEQGVPPPPIDLETLRAAHWIAAREGIGGRAIDPRSGRPATARQLLDALIKHVRDSLDELQEFRLVNNLLRRELETGTGSHWQRRALREYGDAATVVGLAARRTLQDSVPIVLDGACARDAERFCDLRPARPPGKPSPSPR